MFLYVFATPPLETNCYVVGCEKTKQAVVIDPGQKSLQTISSLLEKENASLKMILLTHSHWDHIGGVKILKTHYPNANILVHETDAPNLKEPGSDGLPSFVPIEGVTPDAFLKEGDVINLGDLSFKVIETPGHSCGSVCFFFEKQRVLFSGDTLFKGAIGNLSFPTSEPKKMRDSLKKLFLLPKETVIYPGHGEKTTIEAERSLSFLPKSGN
jgi:glyoxylase-like metal-dependent hydrolase (beta-lactamase superfamily II)